MARRSTSRGRGKPIPTAFLKRYCWRRSLVSLRVSMIAVIADDLSGAAELAGVACRHGLSAEVQTVFSRFSNADVICVDTDSRSLSSAKAAEKVAVVAG